MPEPLITLTGNLITPTLIGDTNVTHEASDYTDLGATWSDAVDGGTITGVGWSTIRPGTYTLTFDYTDSNGNAGVTAPW